MTTIAKSIDQFAGVNLAERHGVVERAGCGRTTRWPWLLLPIILTTVFVIFGAWRRAVRDAEVEAVGEDE